MSTSMHKNILIIGTGEYSEIVTEYFERDTDHRVVAYAAHREHIGDAQHMGKPVVALEECEQHYPPDTHCAFVAVTSAKLNRVRALLYETVKGKNYQCPTYVSPHAFVDPSVELGENVLIFEENVVQRGCRIGSNTIFWSGNHIGHRTQIGSHVFISSHVVLSDSCRVGDYAFLGVNVAAIPSVTIGADCTIGAGVTLTKSIPDNSVVKPADNIHIKEGVSRRMWKAD